MRQVNTYRTLQWMLVLSVLLVGFGEARAQQTWQQSQYIQNSYLVNPAIAGEKDMLEIDLSYRQQWLGIGQSPRTFYVSANSRILKPKVRTRITNVPTSKMRVESGKKRKLEHAIGGLVLRDEFGAFSQTLMALSYGIHLPVSRSWTIATALEGSVKNFAFDISALHIQDLEDPAFDKFYTNAVSDVNTWQPNIDVGIYAYSKYLFVGYSTEQLIEAKLDYSEVALSPALSRSHNVYVGGNIQWSRDWVLTPSTLIKVNEDAPNAYDFNLKLAYTDRYFLAGGYRLGDAIVASIGLFISDRIRLGYSYDFTVSRLNLVSTGSHEFFLGFELFKK